MRLLVQVLSLFSLILGCLETPALAIVALPMAHYMAVGTSLPQPPVINSLSATSVKIPVGQAATLNWDVSGASSVSLDQGLGVQRGTSVTVAPKATTVYTLTASNGLVSKTAKITVTVGTPPVISKFTAPATLVSGQAANLAWTVTGQKSLTIDQGVGAVTGTSRKVSPSADTTYKLTATNDFGSTTATASIKVGTLPTINSFTAAGPKLASGSSTTLNWSVANATSLSIDQGVGAVTGTSTTVSPATTKTYTLTANNAWGSKTAKVTITVGALPTISSFTGTAKVSAGQSATLTWAVKNATSTVIDNSIGTVTGTSTKVTPSATTTYTLTATNGFGSQTATITVQVGAPTITSFTASPSMIVSGGSTTLSWTAVGATSYSISPSIGSVTGTSVTVKPVGNTTYTLTATNASGSATATASVTIGSLPVINTFFANPNIFGGPGVSVPLTFSVSGATTTSIDNGVGTVTTSPVSVSPTGPTTYTLTATNPIGSVTATAKVNYIPLVTDSAALYHSEHVLFVIPSASQVTWTGSASWNSVYSTANINSYVSTLKTAFPSDYFFVVIAANNLLPNSVPNVLTYRYLADGIGENSIKGVGVPNICRYNLGGGTVTPGAFGVLDHEIGHNWGVFIGTEVGTGHWRANSTALGQMADIYSNDGYVTDLQISGDPNSGFTWAAIDNIKKNETETFSDQDLYLQGVNESFPPVYVLQSPVYNSDHTVTYTSFAKYDQPWVEQKNGVRSPSYKTSEKRHRIGFIYVARDKNEIITNYQAIERSADQFINAEAVDTKNFRFQVPYLVNTKFRSSLDGLLADLDGNHTPTLTITGATYLTSNDGTATVPFTAADADGTAPTVTCVPASQNCGIVGSQVVLTGLSAGTHFVTIKAQDAGGKKAFAHLVVDVQ